MVRRLSLEWLQLKRMIGLGPSTPDQSMEGQLRYDRNGDVDGAVYLGRYLAGGTYEWKDLTAGGGGGGAPTTAKYITQVADAGLSAEQALSSLSTGMMQSTTTTGVVQTRTLTGTANEVTVTNGDGSGGNPTFGLATGIDATKIGAGGVTSTEFGYIGGLTSDAQTQIDSKLGFDAVQRLIAIGTQL